MFFYLRGPVRTGPEGLGRPLPKIQLTPFIDASQIATLFFLTVVPYTVATIIPSWRAAT